MRFANVIAAVEQREKYKVDVDGKYLWAIGDALIKDVGAPHQDGRQDGSHAKLKSAATEIYRRGFKEYKLQFLSELRATAHAFPRSRRYAELAFFAHSEAVNPDILDWIVKEHGIDISGRDVRSYVAEWRAYETAKREAKKKQAKTDKAHAKTDAERERAQRVIDENSAMPKPKEFVAPKGEDKRELAVMSDFLQIDLDATSMVKTLRQNLATIHKRSDEIHADFVEALVERHEEVAKIATQIADYLGKAKTKRFSVLKGGAV